MKNHLLIALLVFCVSSCKKTWTCECSNSNGTYKAGEYEGTKSKAKKHCQGLSSQDTNCYVK
ncbi:MAG TPA: hypothetical protein PLQ93_09880 [Bacteroidia bacterium]|nr:hypothetical protein [Bacteroidia bacterium]